MLYEVCDTDSYITWPYQIADHYCRNTWVYNKSPEKKQIVRSSSNIFWFLDINITCKNYMPSIILDFNKYSTSLQQWPGHKLSIR